MNTRKRKPSASAELNGLGRVMVTGEQLRSLPQRPCPVCCRHLARDRDMIVLRRHGSRWWVCKSNLEVGDEGCGFSFRMGMRSDYVDRLVDKCVQHISGRAGQVARGQLQGR